MKIPPEFKSCYCFATSPHVCSNCWIKGLMKAVERLEKQLLVQKGLHRVLLRKYLRLIK